MLLTIRNADVEAFSSGNGIPVPTEWFNGPDERLVFINKFLIESPSSTQQQPKYDRVKWDLVLQWLSYGYPHCVYPEYDAWWFDCNAGRGGRPIDATYEQDKIWLMAVQRQ